MNDDELLEDDEQSIADHIQSFFQIFFIGALGIIIGTIIFLWIFWGDVLENDFKEIFLDDYTFVLNEKQVDRSAIDLDDYYVKVNDETKEVILVEKSF